MLILLPRYSVLTVGSRFVTNSRQQRMLKKSLIVLLLVVIVLAGLAWLNRVDILLGLVKFRSDREFVVAPNTAVPWE